jgi:predicted acetyltransferase
MSRYCGFISKDWAMPKDGLYECFDFKKYFEDDDNKAYLVKLEDGELVGFVLLRLFKYQMQHFDDFVALIFIENDLDIIARARCFR